MSRNKKKSRRPRRKHRQRQLMHELGSIAMIGCTLLEVKLVLDKKIPITNTGIVIGVLLPCLSYFIPYFLVWIGKKIYYQTAGLKRIDALSGEQFEEFLATYYRANGYRVRLTKTTGDFGADLILKKKGETTVVQAKRYKNAVGIEAVQQIIGGKAYYHADKMVVATNSYYTKAAKELAEESGVTLLDRNDVAKMSRILRKEEAKERKDEHYE